MVLLRAFSPPNENVELKLENTQAHIHSGYLGSGTLYIAHSKLVWLNESGQGFSLEYPAISLHAISKDTSSFPHQCLYVMLDSSLASEFEDEKDSDDDDATAQDESATVREVRFVPPDSSTLESMYTAMSQCQMLHPDPEDEFSEEEEDEEGDYETVEDGALENGGQFFTDPSGLEMLTPEGRATLNRLMNVMDIQDPRVEDRPGGGSVNGAGDGPKEVDQFDDADMDK